MIVDKNFVSWGNKLVLTELFSKTYDLVKNNLILVQPLLIFLLVLSFITSPLTSGMGISTAVIVMIISILGLFCAFFAGWYSMFHKSIEYVDKLNLSPEEKALNSINLFKEFFPGVGKYFLKIILGYLLYFMFFIILLNVIHILGEKLIGLPTSINTDEFSKIATDEQKLLNFVHKISLSDWIKIIKWNVMSFTACGLFSYITMFWIQALIIEGKRPLIAYWESIKTVFKNPIVTIIIYIAQCASIVGVCLISIAMSMNIIAQFIILMILILLVVYFTMMSFLYFEKYR